jgi:hypothetical protein
MKLTEFAEVIDETLLITFSPSCQTWQARFEDSSLKNDAQDPFLRGEFGTGANPQAALADYVQKIRGRILIFDSADERAKFNVPKTLEV